MTKRDENIYKRTIYFFYFLEYLIVIFSKILIRVDRHMDERGLSLRADPSCSDKGKVCHMTLSIRDKSVN